MRFVRLSLAVAIMSGVFVLSTPTAGACSCGAGTEQQNFDRADVVFEGTVVTDEKLDNFLAVVTFDVEGVYKGDARQTQPIYTHAQSSACGLDVVTGGDYVVFANVIDGEEIEPGYPIGDLKAFMCGGYRTAGSVGLEVEPPVEPVAPIATASTTTSTVAPATSSATEDLAEPFTGGSVLVVGFIAVGIVGAFVASRIAKRSRES